MEKITQPRDTAITKKETKKISVDLLETMHDENTNIQKFVHRQKVKADMIRSARHITDNNVLDLLSISRDPKIRHRVILNRNTDQTILSDIARNDPNKKLRLLAKNVLKRRINKEQKRILKEHLESKKRA